MIKILKAKHRKAFDHYELKEGERFIGAPYRTLDEPEWWCIDIEVIS